MIGIIHKKGRAGPRGWFQERSEEQKHTETRREERKCKEKKGKEKSQDGEEKGGVKFER